MIAAVRSEIKKLFSVRSTYITLLLIFAFLILGSFYIAGWHNGVYDASYLTQTTISKIPAVAVFATVPIVLLMAHEYRYNTITYSLTLSNSRSKVLFAKFIVALLFAAAATIVFFWFSVGVSQLGAALANHPLPAQDFPWVKLLLRSLYFCCGFSLIGLLITSLVRNLTASIMALFIVPNIVEGLLTFVLKHNVVYLPFTALSQVVTLGPVYEGNGISVYRAAVVFGAYLAAGWIIGWAAFVRRDAN